MAEPYREIALLVGLELSGKAGRTSADTPEYSAEESLDELAVLARSAGAEVVDKVLQVRPARTAATLIGAGKVEEIATRVKAYNAQTVVFDDELTPTQLRNLERELDCKVIDRTQLILDIFARRARTREGQLQVELAQLNYLLPRLTGRGVQMSRLGGGIGTRGPGETQLETDRRRIARRIKKIEDDLEGVRAGRKVQRSKRQAVPLETVALVGYTNAGKSTLFNRLTGAGVVADARMFATLDPTVRQIVLPSNRRALLSDTVGFIRNLPTTLVRAFRATLEEVVEASLLLHVVDASAPHAAEQTAHVLKVLTEIGAGKTPQLLVLNKLDQLPDDHTDATTIGRRLLGESETHEPMRAVGVSALQGRGVDKLMALIDEGLPKDPVSHARFRFPLSQGAPLSFLHDYARVTATRYTEDACEVEADVPESVRRRLAEFLAD
ncbi:MAG: GTPase HflX [Bryobacteraceae bacterium]|nr:GTPase HflX [Bryobacteraceae bacterium]